ncbi:RecE family exodeoxyribonuclease [Enterobacter asburiae]|uniref:RecE family exodeoxyribonuclease n=1 Tax=Enterobacter asburiae TaxID=61645 RepID=A0ABU6KTQ6_ENTAS|nr:RecE family exodeoxyribonuclease [Enterobacter asburiae]MCK1017186.1 PD-(D/E)XK nuclease-like domain-containing protein [Enterobacter asburiae]MDU2341952.1 RecE family exodeoxyribonuclease [Enterobacter asburiae]MEC5729354.1 RecE family exodeoxyribonuclease [Enterobacter asburiae]MEC5861304.1 RecE family exodeoxyribonuclease [Enterobacter asburiae]HCD6082117.1 PD-(D/E)XK nuclease-like domain-containing protein [Enterobacter asburiae]
MSEAKPYFINLKAKKQSGEPHAVFWETAKTESRALRDAENALEDAEKDPANYFKAVVTNFPVVNELPPEGEISFTFCNFYQLGDDGMTWQQIPGVTLPAHPGEKVVEGTDTTIVDGVDTSTGEIVDEQALNEAGTVPESNPDLKIDVGDDEHTRYPIVQMSFRKQLLSQLTSDALRYHLTQAEYHEIAKLEMDTDNGYVQNLLLAAASVEQIQKLDMPFLWKYTKAVRDVFDIEKRHELSLVLKFTQVWAETSHLDRGILTKEWAKGNRISGVQRTDSGTNADGGYKTDRGEGVQHTLDTLDLEIACATLPMDFNPHEIPGSVLRRAKEIITKKEEPWKSWSYILRNLPGILGVNRFAIFNIIRIAPENIHQDTVKHLEFCQKTMTDEFNRATELLPLPTAQPGITSETVDKLMVEQSGGFVEGISDPTDPKWDTAHRRAYTTHEENLQRVREEGARRRVEGAIQKPEVENLGGGVFSIDGLLNQNASNEGEKTEAETTSNVQVQTTDSDEEQAGAALPPGEGANCVCLETAVTSNAEILAAAAPHLSNQESGEVNQKEENAYQTDDSAHQNEPKAQQNEPEVKQWPTRFEPGRYENVPNAVYHSANGISSTMLKDVLISPMYYHGRHIAGTIPREQNDAMLRGTIIHSYVLEPEKFEDEFAVPAEMPGHVVSTTADLVAIIKEYNASLPALMTPDELKAWIEEYNATLTPPLSVSAGAEETANLYMSLPEEFQRIPADGKQTAAAQKACIKEYNASLPPLLKVSGTREQLLEQIATVDPEFAESERAKFVPYNISGTKDQLTEVVRIIRPDVVTAEDWHQQQEDASQGKTMIALDMYEQAKRISAALQAHPSASRLLNHPARQSEVSYFGFDEDTGLEVRVRPDLEIQLPHARIGGDLKTTSLGYVKKDELKARLHREITSRGYHLSAAMYCDTANLDQFFWIFVNRDEGYHWIAIVEASPDLLDLGRKEYRLALRTINECMETNTWPAPIVEDYTDELNDFDLRRLEALGAM